MILHNTQREKVTFEKKKANCQLIPISALGFQI